MDTLDYIISSRTEFDYNFRKDYLGWHIHYHLGSDERRGHCEDSWSCCASMGWDRSMSRGMYYEPRYVL